MKKKILFITSQASHYMIKLYDEIAKKYDITFLFTQENNKKEGIKAKQELIRGIGYKKYKIHFFLFFKLLRENYDLVELLPLDPLQTIDNFLCFLALKLRKKPYICWTKRWEYKTKGLKQKITDPINIFILKRAKAIVAGGTKHKEFVLSQGIEKEKVFVMPSINPVIYSNMSMKKSQIPFPKELNNFKNKKIVLYVGRLIERKGLKYLIEAFSDINNKEAILVIVGGGDFYKLGAKNIRIDLENLVKKLKMNNKVIFIGAVKPERTKEFYNATNIFVLPSITTNIGEAWGHVVEEAMSFGKPVISTDAVGASYDLIKNGKNGFMVKEKNSKEIKNAIDKILKSSELERKMGKESVKILKENYPKKDMIKGFVDAVESIGK